MLGFCFPADVFCGTTTQLSRNGAAAANRRRTPARAAGTVHATEHLPAADFETVGDIRVRWLEEEGRIRRFVAELGPGDIDRVMDYRFFDGEPMRAVFRHMLQHVVNHATYHRGQVTTMLRQLGAEPPRNQGLIGFYLEQA